MRLAYFSDTPKPIAGPSNCEKCNDKFIKMFDEYRETLDPKVLFEEIQCECKKYIIRWWGFAFIFLGGKKIKVK